VLCVSHNQLSALPDPVLGMPSLRELHAGSNAIQELAGPMQLMEGLQVAGAVAGRATALCCSKDSEPENDGRVLFGKEGSTSSNPTRSPLLLPRAGAGRLKQPPSPPAICTRLAGAPAAQRHRQPRAGDAAEASARQGP
jgi:hypothetical protein